MDIVSIIRIFAGLAAVAALVVGILYILALSNTLAKCSPVSRTMQPGMVWLLLVPIFCIIWHFFVVLAVARSLANEFRARNIQSPEPEPGKTIGIVMCVCGACMIIPFVNILAGLAGLVAWIMYWVKIAEYSRMVDSMPVMMVPQR